jgi:lysophospholipase L1-like esterase
MYPQSDGVHMTVEGGVKVAEAVLAVVAREWHMPPFK